MAFSKKVTLLVTALALVAGVVFWFSRQESPDFEVDADSPVWSGMKASDRPDIRGEVDEERETSDDGADVLEPDADDPALETLGELLPAWLHANGDKFHDEREIDGHTVLRSRGRYEWENGEQLEIEITDAGDKADESLVKSLGFNTELEDTETETGFTATQQEPGYHINQEYDSVDQSGSIQLLVENRYLVEIHITNMPEEAFQEVIDRDVSFDKIFERVEE